MLIPKYIDDHGMVSNTCFGILVGIYFYFSIYLGVHIDTKSASFE